VAVINPFMNRTTLVASAGCNFPLNGCNITVEYLLQNSNANDGAASNWYTYPALGGVDLNFNTLANVDTLYVDNIYSSGDPINFFMPLILYGGIDLQLMSIDNVSNTNLQTINGLPYGTGTPSNWAAFPANATVDMNFKTLLNIDTLFIDTINSTYEIQYM
jgi:hypothetical protein